MNYGSICKYFSVQSKYAKKKPANASCVSRLYFRIVRQAIYCSSSKIFIIWMAEYGIGVPGPKMQATPAL